MCRVYEQYSRHSTVGIISQTEIIGTVDFCHDIQHALFNPLQDQGNYSSDYQRLWTVTSAARPALGHCWASSAQCWGTCPIDLSPVHTGDYTADFGDYSCQCGQGFRCIRLKAQTTLLRFVVDLLLRICCTTVNLLHNKSTTNPKQIEIMEFVLNALFSTNTDK